MTLNFATTCEVFDRLAQWAGRETLQQQFLLENHDFLSTKGVTDDQLRFAASAWRVKSRFFPCPQDLLDEVFLGQADRALTEWTAIALARPGQPAEGLSDIGREALQAIGGRWAIDSTPSGVARKHFLEMHGAITRKRATEQVQRAASQLRAVQGYEALPPVKIDISGIGGEP